MTTHIGLALNSSCFSILTGQMDDGRRLRQRGSITSHLFGCRLNLPSRSSFSIYISLDFSFFFCIRVIDIGLFSFLLPDLFIRFLLCSLLFRVRMTIRDAATRSNTNGVSCSSISASTWFISENAFPSHLIRCDSWYYSEPEMPLFRHLPFYRPCDTLPLWFVRGLFFRQTEGVRKQQSENKNKRDRHHNL